MKDKIIIEKIDGYVHSKDKISSILKSLRPHVSTWLTPKPCKELDITKKIRVNIQIIELND